MPPRQPKLRDSCIACSASKVKCQKEKPTCSRCSERGIKCEYATSRRTGRQSYTAHSATSPAHKTLNVALPSLRPAARELDDTSQWQNKITGSANWSAQRREQDATETNQELPDNTSAKPLNVPRHNNAMNPLSQKSLPTSAQVDDFFKFLNTQMDGQENQTEMSLHPADFMNNQASTNEDMSLDPDFDARNGLGLDDKLSFLPDELSFSDVMSLDPSDLGTYLKEQYSCMPTGLLTPTSLSRTDRPVTTPGSPRESVSDNSVCFISEAAISKNKHIVDSMITILICHRSIDERLLTVLSLIACRVIAWYAAVARDESTRSVIASHLRVLVDSRSTEPKDVLADQVHALSLEIGSANVDETDQRCVAIRSVIGEAHRVQKLADLLSNRLENIRLHNDLACLAGQNRATTNDVTMGQPVANVMAPSVVQMFDTLETGLRSRLDSVVSKGSLQEVEDQYRPMGWNEPL
ncbi:hypothetical protein MBLNU13_g02440t1 [Cladosporium sp. NU13]